MARRPFVLVFALLFTLGFVGCATSESTGGGPPSSEGGNGCNGGTLCGSTCTNLATDPANCGGCGLACLSGQLCSAGTCGGGCSAGTTQCGSQCVDTQSSPDHCGGCDNACPSGEVCNQGTCLSGCSGGTTACAGALAKAGA